LLSPLIGVVVGYGILGFRYAIDFIHWLWLGADMESLLSSAAGAPWWQIAAGPLIVGVLAALVLRWLPPDGRPQGVADILMAHDLKDKHISPKAGLASAAYAAMCLGGGGSAGRESPAIHLGVAMTASMTRIFSLPHSATHLLFACGTGAAVAASFNAPFAGMLFAHEIILRHIALPAIMPIAIACAAATAITRIHLGEYPAFSLADIVFAPTHYTELGYFAVLGLVCALVATAFVYLTFRLMDLSKKIPGPDWTRPLFVGMVTACAGVALPGVLGIGYEITDAALKMQLSLGLAVLLLVVKLVLTSMTLAGRFGGGVFSPALYLGAVTGATFAFVLQFLLPTIGNHYALYVVAGMGGVSAAVLGAPLSTIMIAFELIGDYKVTLALMVTATIATALTHIAVGDGFFRLQAERMGLKVRPHGGIITKNGN
jgi:CIC family chloride channel protein